MHKLKYSTVILIDNIHVHLYSLLFKLHLNSTCLTAEMPFLLASQANAE